jgi:hypothetical protein
MRITRKISRRKKKRRRRRLGGEVLVSQPETQFASVKIFLASSVLFTRRK